MIIKNEKGLTLLELIAAMTIIAIVIILFINLSGTVNLAFGKEDKNTAAERIASQELNKRLGAILAATPVPNENSQNSPPYSADGFQIVVNESAVTANPVYTNLTPGQKMKSVQGIAVLYDPGTSSYVPRLITVTAMWGG